MSSQPCAVPALLPEMLQAVQPGSQEKQPSISHVFMLFSEGKPYFQGRAVLQFVLLKHEHYHRLQ